MTDFEPDRLFDGPAWLDSGYLEDWGFRGLHNDLLLACTGLEYHGKYLAYMAEAYRRDYVDVR